MHISKIICNFAVEINKSYFDKLMKTIESIHVSESGHYAFGTTFRKGDYIATEKRYLVKFIGGLIREISRKDILSWIGGNRQRITQTSLKSLEGKDVDI